MAATLTVPDIILRLKRIEIFEGLSVNQLAAIASVTEEESVDAAEIVIRQGDAGDSMYLVIDGETAVIKQQPDGAEVELDRIGPGDYFGEMALIEDIPRSATIRTVSPTRLLLLRKQEFNEMVREYPQIALEICRILGGRIRRLHEKIGRNQRSESPSDDQ